MDVTGFTLASFSPTLSAFPCPEPLVHLNVRLASLTRSFGRTCDGPFCNLERRYKAIPG